MTINRDVIKAIFNVRGQMFKSIFYINCPYFEQAKFLVYVSKLPHPDLHSYFKIVALLFHEDENPFSRDFPRSHIRFWSLVRIRVHELSYNTE